MLFWPHYVRCLVFTPPFTRCWSTSSLVLLGTSPWVSENTWLNGEPQTESSFCLSAGQCVYKLVLCVSRYICCNQHHDWERDGKAGTWHWLFCKWHQWLRRLGHWCKGCTESPDSMFHHGLDRNLPGVFLYVPYMNAFKTFREFIVMRQKNISQPSSNSLCVFRYEDPAGSSEVWFCGHIPVWATRPWLHNWICMSRVYLSAQVPVWSNTSSLCWSSLSHLCEYGSPKSHLPEILNCISVHLLKIYITHMKQVRIWAELKCKYSLVNCWLTD